MNKINNLIKELCPNGVEFKPLRDVCIKVQDGNYGKDYPKVNELQKEGIALINGKAIHGKIVKDAVDYITEEKNEQMKKARIYTGDVLFLNRGNIGETAMVTEEYNNCNIGPQVTLLRANQDFIKPKFLEYILHSNHVREIINTFTGSTIKFVSVEPMRNMIIPVPPLQIQEEIVRILGKFDELEANLEAELESRKSQYEFWRNKMFKNTNNLITIGETCDVITGGEPPEDTIKGSEADDEHPYPVYGNGREIYGYSSSYRVDKDSTVISSIGANAGAIYYREAYFTPIIRLKVVIPKSDELLPRYLYYALQTSKIKSKSGSVPNLNANDIKSIEFPLVPVEQQQHIVNILDKFDTLVNDIFIGLPAEIELRKKQYEYYRNKLLSFEELSVSE